MFLRPKGRESFENLIARENWQNCKRGQKCKNLTFKGFLTKEPSLAGGDGLNALPPCVSCICEYIVNFHRVY